MKNILIFVASNSKHSFTEEILKEIALELNSMSEGEFFIDTISIRALNILNCEGCANCFLTGSCKLDRYDDMLMVKEKFLKSDTIVFASPVYANHIPGIAKNLLDRISCWIHILRLAGKDGIIITTASRMNIGQANNYLQMFFAGLGVSINRSINIINKEQNRVNYISKAIYNTIINMLYFI